MSVATPPLSDTSSWRGA